MFKTYEKSNNLKRLSPIAVVASWLAQSVVAKVPSKYLSEGPFSVVCQNNAGDSNENFHVFLKECDSWV